MPYYEEKPCVFFTSAWHDHKRRLYNSNILHGIAEKLVCSLIIISTMWRGVVTNFKKEKSFFFKYLKK